MNIYTVVALAFGPGVFWLWYFYKKDKLEPEPKTLVLTLFVLGMIAVIPAFAAEVGINYILQSVSPSLMMMLAAPVIEESCKFWVVRRFVFNHVEFDEPMDGIVYAAAVALGFASLENLSYIGCAYFNFLEHPETTARMVLSVCFTRAVFSVPGHVLFSVMWGYALGASKFINDPKRARLFVRRGLILSMILHGIFNAFLNFPLALTFLLAFMLVAWRMVRARITVALLNSPFANPANLAQEFEE
jgi:protease PrsW